jgi:hypothetical protein
MIRTKIFSPRLRWTVAAVVLVWAALLLAGVVVLGGIALPRPVRAQGWPPRPIAVFHEGDFR